MPKLEMRSDTPLAKFKCPNCDEQIQEENDLRNSPSLVCDKCGFSFNQRRNWTFNLQFIFEFLKKSLKMVSLILLLVIFLYLFVVFFLFSPTPNPSVFNNISLENKK